jgi:hypothetical protein
LQAIGVKLRRAGRGTLIGKCPIHRERRGLSFAIFAGRRWRCFGKCAHGGDVIDLDIALNDGGVTEAVKRIQGMNLGEALPLDEYADRLEAAQSVITPENPLGVPYHLSEEQRATGAKYAHRLATSNYWLTEISTWRGWKRETIQALAAEGSLGIDPAARLCFLYESGLKFRYTNLDTGERIIRWRWGKPTLWRISRLETARKVYLSEGEPDAISLVDEGVERERGVSVLAVPCASFRLSPLASLFKDKEVVLVPDADKTGLNAATNWACALEPHVESLSYLSYLPKEGGRNG